MISMNVNATDIVDVNGLNPHESEKIIKQYGKQVAQIESMLQKELKKMELNEGNIKLVETLSKKKQVLIENITKKNQFLFVDFQSIFYFNDDNLYTTIEIIDKEHSKRLQFIGTTAVGIRNEKKRLHEPDLIDEMINYEHVGLKMMLNHQIDFKFSDCPVYHCVMGFGHPKLKPYLVLFNNGVIKEKKLIIDTLHYDQDPERRAAAVFLVGHFQDPKEIVSLLSPYVVDGNSSVRNNVMRVIGETIDKAKMDKLDLKPFLNILDSPYTTDRNKALSILLTLANSEASINEIIQLGGDKILSLMQLKQPNNHDPAYLVLKKISGKDFGPTNLSAWTEWVSSAKH